MNIALYYASLSGNTESVVRHIVSEAATENITIHTYKIPLFGALPKIVEADVYMVGCYTDGDGRVPDEVKDWIDAVGYKPESVAVFGTGETQFPEFCGAVDRLAKFYHSPYDTLKVEQRPFGQQIIHIKEWTKGVIKHGTTKD